MTSHQHEAWQLDDDGDGGLYCLACGEAVGPEADYADPLGRRRGDVIVDRSAGRDWVVLGIRRRRDWTGEHSAEYLVRRYTWAGGEGTQDGAAVWATADRFVRP